MRYLQTMTIMIPSSKVYLGNTEEVNQRRHYISKPKEKLKLC
jgi:hypothetical protein